jgi:MFS family permease
VPEPTEESAVSAPTPDTLRQRRGIRALVTATGTSSVGDGAFIAAAPLAAAAITRDPAAVATVAAAEFLPWLVVAPFAGVYVDRWPRRTTMVIADITRAVAVAALAAFIVAGIGGVPAIAACAFLIMAGTVFHSAAREAITATMATGQQRHTINGWVQSATTAGKQLAGPPVGSALFILAPWAPFLLDAASFATSAALLTQLPPGHVADPDRRPVIEAIRAGARYVFGNRDLRTMVIIIALGNIASNLTLAIMVLYATDPTGLHIAPGAYGQLLVAMAAGGILGGWIAPHLIGRLGTWRTFIVGGIGEATGWLTLALTSNPYIAGAALAASFVAITVVTVVVISARQQLTPSNMLGRVISAFRMVGNGTAPLGAMAGGIVAATWGLRAPMIAAAIMLTVATAFAVRARLSERKGQHIGSG